MNRILIGLITLGLASPVLGESKLTPKKKVLSSRQRSSQVRKIASTESPGNFSDMKVSEGVSARPRKDVGFQLSFLTGLAQTSGSLNTGNAIHFGVQGDLHWGRYFGAEFDGYFAPGLSQEVEGAQVKVGQYGGLANAKARYAIRLGEGAILVPKAGLGFGVQGMTANSTDSNGAVITGAMSSMGLYAVGGLETRLARRLTLDVDFAMSLMGSGSIQTSQFTTPPTVDSAGFNRFRLGASYRLSAPLSLGAQFTYRSVSMSTTGSAGSWSGSTGMNQFLGVLTLHW
jgi:hypothetical protein